MIVANSLKNHTNKILDVWSKLIKQPISTWITVISTSKSRKQPEKEKREHMKFVYPVRSKIDLIWGREQSSVPL